MLKSIATIIEYKYRQFIKIYYLNLEDFKEINNF